jgi:spermidine synthase
VNSASVLGSDRNPLSRKAIAMTNRALQPSRTLSSSWLYGVTILTGAFLVFQVQPIISKTILPWFGGSPSVWTTCMLFFQVLLFGGYLYAHWLSRLRPLWQWLVHLALIGAALWTLPIAPDPSWKPHGNENPTQTILWLLAATVGLPYFLLSSTGPLVQSWFSRSFQRTPYRLYALSNIGSLAALLTYPFLVEPAMSTGVQAAIWSCGFVGFALCCGVLAMKTNRAGGGILVASAPGVPDSSDPAAACRMDTQPRPRSRDRLVWLFLAAVASSMLLATTNHLCQDVAVIPFLWIAPLSLYLVSFIVCFDREQWYSRHGFGLATMISVLTISIFPLIEYVPPLSVEVGLYLTALFCACMVCHGELVLRKPDPRHLTLFYLMVSAGGALGGILVAIACPLLFTSYAEMNLGLISAYALAAFAAFADTKVRWWLQGAQRKRATQYALVGFFCVLIVQLGGMYVTGVVACRNFYGVLRVQEQLASDRQPRSRRLVHGSTCHGSQFLDPRMRRVPTTYFHEQSGVGVLLRTYPRTSGLRVGVIGLGAGTLAAYGQAGDYYRFYEIDPDVERLARTYFTFLSDSAAHIEVILGDARLSMERETRQQFDILVLDAFSGDAIPAHLLTKEAFVTYRRHLRPDGAIAVHISNRHLDLYPVVERLAEHNRMGSLHFLTSADSRQGRLNSQWYVMSNNRQWLSNESVLAAAHGQLGHYAMIPLWTDQYNNLFRLLK